VRQGGGARHVGRHRAGEQPREEFRTIIRDLEQRLVQQEFEHIAAPDIDDERHPRLDRRDIREVLLFGFSATSSIRFLTVNAEGFMRRSARIDQRWATCRLNLANHISTFLSAAPRHVGAGVDRRWRVVISLRTPERAPVLGGPAGRCVRKSSIAARSKCAPSAYCQPVPRRGPRRTRT
jgi:hypothetical protein